MKTFINYNQEGFTLIEILLYLSLSTVMVALLGGIGVNVLSSLTGAKAEEELQYNAQFVTEKIRTYIVAAERIDSPIAGATSSVLSLVMNDQAKNPTTIYVDNERILVQEGGEEAQKLSGRSVVVSDIEFSNVTYDGGIGSIRMVMPIRLFNPDNRTLLRASTTLYTTVNLQYP